MITRKIPRRRHNIENNNKANDEMITRGFYNEIMVERENENKPR